MVKEGMFLQRAPFWNDHDKTKSHTSYFPNIQKNNQFQMSSPITTFVLKQLKVKNHKYLPHRIIDLRRTKAVKHGAIENIISGTQKRFPFMTRNWVNFFIKKKDKHVKDLVQQTVLILTQMLSGYITPTLSSPPSGYSLILSPFSFDQNCFSSEQVIVNTYATSVIKNSSDNTKDNWDNNNTLVEALKTTGH